MKNILTFLILTFLLMIIPVAYANTDASVEVSVDYSTNIATVTGVNLGSGDKASIHIDAPNGQIYYIGAVDLTDGAFTHEFLMLEPTEGEYRASVKTESGLGSVTFNYGVSDDTGVMPAPRPVEDMESSKDVSAIIADSNIKIQGKVGDIAGRWATVIVFDSNRIDFAADTETDSSGNIMFGYKSFSEDLSGLSIRIMAESMITPKTVPVVLTVETDADGISINGNIANGSDRRATVTVRDSTGNVDFVTDTACDYFGHYEVPYTSKIRKQGIHTVSVSVEGFDEPYETSFTYYPALTKPNLTIKSVTNNAVELSWTASEGGTYSKTYDVYRNGMKISSTSGTGYTDTTVQSGKYYTYLIKVTDYNGFHVESGIDRIIAAKTVSVTVSEGDYVSIPFAVKDVIDINNNFLFYAVYNQDEFDGITAGDFPGNVGAYRDLPGELIFWPRMDINDGQTWTGVSGTVQLKAKKEGTFTVYCFAQNEY